MGEENRRFLFWITPPIKGSCWLTPPFPKVVKFPFSMVQSLLDKCVNNLFFRPDVPGLEFRLKVKLKISFVFHRKMEESVSVLTKDFRKKRFTIFSFLDFRAKVSVLSILTLLFMLYQGI